MTFLQYREHLTNTLPFLHRVEPTALSAVWMWRAPDRMARFAAKLRAGMDAEKTAARELGKHGSGTVLPFLPRSRESPMSESLDVPSRFKWDAPAKLKAHVGNILVRKHPDAEPGVLPQVVASSSVGIQPPQARKPRMLAARDLRRMPDGAFVRTAGRMIARQMPNAASGCVSLSIEDETGISNIIVDPELHRKVQLLAAGGKFLQVGGRVEKDGGAVLIRASRIRVFDTAHDPARSLDTF